jgi:hypothetical protein
MIMKKMVFIILVGISASNTILAQADASDTLNGKNNVASFGVNIPVGEFAETHIGGISLNYSWSHHRFGKLNKLPKKLIGFIANAGIGYYLGKKETVSEYDFKYSGYVYLHIFAGAIYNPYKQGNVVLTTGPTLGIYKGNADLGFGVNLNGSYYFNDRIAITPGVIYMKHNKVNALWAFSIKATYILK